MKDGGVNAPVPTNLPPLTQTCPFKFSLLHHFSPSPFRQGVGTLKGVNRLAPIA